MITVRVIECGFEVTTGNHLSDDTKIVAEEVGPK